MRDTASKSSCFCEKDKRQATVKGSDVSRGDDKRYTKKKRRKRTAWQEWYCVKKRLFL